MNSAIKDELEKKKEEIAVNLYAKGLVAFSLLWFPLRP